MTLLKLFFLGLSSLFILSHATAQSESQIQAANQDFETMIQNLQRVQQQILQKHERIYGEMIKYLEDENLAAADNFESFLSELIACTLATTQSEANFLQLWANQPSKKPDCGRVEGTTIFSRLQAHFATTDRYMGESVHVYQQTK